MTTISKYIIYVGPTVENTVASLHYGMTGEIPDWTTDLITFVPHGTDVEFSVKTQHIYQAQIDKTRYCPKR